MGSPYMQFTVSRVNVIKSERGFRQLLSEIANITSCDCLNEGNFLNWSLDGDSLRWQHTDWSSDLLNVIREDVAGQVWEMANDADIWSTSLGSIIGLIADFRIARYYDLRLVSIFATSYETSETRYLDRAVVIDYTKPGVFVRR